MSQQETKRKLREDLTDEQREQAERIGSIEFKSSRVKFSRDAHTEIFIPSREQH